MVWRRVTYRFVKTSGPERIGVEWWTLPYAASPKATAVRCTRDYYVVEDDGGRRFWLFREGLYAEAYTQRWYLARVLRMSDVVEFPIPLERPDLEPGTKPYAELMTTSNFSFLRGGSSPQELVIAAAALGTQWSLVFAIATALPAWSVPTL